MVTYISIVERVSIPNIAATSIPPFSINLSRNCDSEIRSSTRSSMKFLRIISACTLFLFERFHINTFSWVDLFIAVPPFFLEFFQPWKAPHISSECLNPYPVCWCIFWVHPIPPQRPDHSVPQDIINGTLHFIYSDVISKSGLPGTDA